MIGINVSVSIGMNANVWFSYGFISKIFHSRNNKSNTKFLCFEYPYFIDALGNSDVSMSIKSYSETGHCTNNKIFR